MISQRVFVNSARRNEMRCDRRESICILGLPTYRRAHTWELRNQANVRGDSLQAHNQYVGRIDEPVIDDRGAN